MDRPSSAHVSDCASSEPFLEQEEGRNFHHPDKRKSRPSKAFIAFLVSNSIWAALFLLWPRHRYTFSCPTNEATHSTDFASIVPFLAKPKTTIFDDELRYNMTDGEFWRDLDTSSPQYFGPPSPEIDVAWAELLRGEFLGVSSDEILRNSDLEFRNQDINPTTGHFHIAIDVFHSLHCLNAVRKQLDKAYCHPSQPTSSASSKDSDTDGLPEAVAASSGHLEKMKNHHNFWSTASQRVHIDHCLNHIRQSLQCHPDLSPAAMTKQVATTGDVFYLGNAKRHTCADWAEIKRWVDERRMSNLGAWDE